METAGEARAEIQVLSTLLVLGRCPIGGQRCACSRSLTLQEHPQEDFATFKVKIRKGRKTEQGSLSQGLLFEQQGHKLCVFSSLFCH